MPINSFMSWVGGKRNLRDLVLSRFPPYYERYIEVFGGGGWVLFHKAPDYGVMGAPVELPRVPAVTSAMEAKFRQAANNDFEVYNDFNGQLVNLYHCVREQPQELVAELQYVLNAREDFELIRHRLKSDYPLTDVQRAAYFYQQIRYSYASGLTSFGSQPHDMWSNFPIIGQAHHRLRKVVVEHKDCVSLIKQYDRPVSLFYCDPPYFGTESYYENVGKDGFGVADHIRLHDALMQIEGKFLLSYNDCDFVRELYSADGIYMEETERLDNIKQRYDSGAVYKELLIANYDLFERERSSPEQLNLFE